MNIKKFIFRVLCFFPLFNFGLASDVSVEDLILVRSDTNEEITVITNFLIIGNKTKIEGKIYQKKILKCYFPS